MFKVLRSYMMHKYRFIFHSLVFFFACGSSLAQWQSDVRLTNDPAESITSFNNSRTLAANGSYLHIVWTDYRNNDIEIYYKRSTDGGLSWGADTRLTTTPDIPMAPSIAVSGSIVYVLWVDSRDSNTELYYKRSIDQGESWEADVRLTQNEGASMNPSISVIGQNIHVTWEDYRDAGLFGYPEIYYKRSTDGGLSWGADTRLTSDPAESYYPSVSASGNFVHVSFEDNRNGQVFDLYYKRSTDGGASWQPEVSLTDGPSNSVAHSITSSGSMVHIIGQELGSQSDIHYIRSADGGTSWKEDTLLTENSGSSEYPSISVSEQLLHIVWQDNSSGNWEIYYKRSTNEGVSWGQDINITNNTSSSHYPFVAASGMNTHIIWMDNRDSNFEIYYKQDPTGNVIGLINYITAIADDFLLYQNYPNPFNPVTNFEFRIKNWGLVNLTVYDILGREVTTLVNEQLFPGTYIAEWNAANYPSGIYFYTLQTGDFRETRKMILMK